MQLCEVSPTRINGRSTPFLATEGWNPAQCCTVSRTQLRVLSARCVSCFICSNGDQHNHSEGIVIRVVHNGVKTRCDLYTAERNAAAFGCFFHVMCLHAAPAHRSVACTTARARCWTALGNAAHADEGWKSSRPVPQPSRFTTRRSFHPRAATPDYASDARRVPRARHTPR